MEFRKQGIKIDHKINGGGWKCQEEYQQRNALK
jgi:hypothetical protein